MKRLIWIPIAVVVFLSMQIPEAHADQVRIGFVIDGPSEIHQQILTEMQNEIRSHLADEFEVVFSKKNTLISDWTGTAIRDAFSLLLKSQEVDMVITIGYIASDIACRTKDLPKPVIAPFVLDAGFQQAPFQDGKSGRKNLHYLATPWRLEQELNVFRSVYPFRKLALLGSRAMEKHLAKHYDQIKAKAYLQKSVKDYVVVLASKNATQALRAIPADVDAVYLLPMFQMNQKQTQLLIDGLNKRKLPSFSAFGRQHVEMGVLAGVRPTDDNIRLARQVAINLHRILLGEEPGQLPVAFSPGSRLSINVRTSRKIGTSPPFSVIFDAERVQDEVASARLLTVRTAIKEALNANLTLALAQQDILVGAQNRHIAMSDLLPKVDLGTQALLIDTDRAQASMGAMPQFGWTASVTLRQVLAEGAFANVSIQTSLQQARELRRDEIELDVIEATIAAYLRVLQASVTERIQNNNVRLSHSNLDLARRRQAIGAARQSEVYRWQSEIAGQRQGVVSAHLQHSLAELEMNRILKRPMEEEFVPEQLRLDATLFTGGNRKIFDLLDNPRGSKAFRSFVVNDALVQSPEVAQLKKNLAAVERKYASAVRSFWLPALVVSGQLNQRMVQAGQGTDRPELPEEMANVGSLFPEQDDTTWNVAVALSWPLFEGGLRWAKTDRARAEINRIKVQLEQIKQGIEQRVRSALQASRASGANLRLARQAAQAAKKNLNLVVEGYSRGAVSILDLLDAQNASLVADLAAVNAEFAFMVDMVRSQRAAGGFFITAEAGKKNAWFKRMRSFINQQKLQ